MTKIQWAALTPEQKNRLIAEKVFGYPADQLVGFPIPCYTTDLNAVWMIMNYIKPGRSDNPGMSLGITSKREAHDTFMIRARFVDQLDNMPGWWSWERKRLCNAICVAALRSVGLEIEE